MQGISMTMKFATFLSLCLLLAIPPYAQVRRAGWNTYGVDPQRTGWERNESDLKRENVKDLKVECSVKHDNASKELNSLTVPLVRGQLITQRGFKEVVIVAGASDKVFAIDSDSGRVFWEKTMAVAPPPAGRKESH